MSLINDALRRSNQQKKEQAPGPSDGAPMQPVYSSQRGDASFRGPMLLIFFLGVVLTCAVWFFWKSWSARSTTPQITSSEVAPRKTELIKSPASNVFPSAAEKAVPAVPIKQEPPTVAIGENAAPTNSDIASGTPVTEVTPPTPPPPPALKLQGIFYRISNPTALINGKTVAVDERVDGARVVTISRNDVTLERDGETIVLMLR